LPQAASSDGADQNGQCVGGRDAAVVVHVADTRLTLARLALPAYASLAFGVALGLASALAVHALPLGDAAPASSLRAGGSASSHTPFAQTISASRVRVA